MLNFVPIVYIDIHFAVVYMYVYATLIHRTLSSCFFFNTVSFWEIAARSVNNLFSLYFVYLFYLFISRFGFKSGICLLIAPVPVHCFSITFCKMGLSEYS